tara:strand:- start:201 stop:488 length:288 start_codon:yes stop_codon:yes gene_type:complete
LDEDSIVALEERRKVMPFTEEGHWVKELPKAAVVKEAPDLDFEAITRTLATIKEWLESEAPSQEDAMKVFQYELDNANRTGAVGDEGCLTEYLEN